MGDRIQEGPVGREDVRHHDQARRHSTKDFFIGILPDYKHGLLLGMQCQVQGAVTGSALVTGVEVLTRGRLTLREAGADHINARDLWLFPGHFGILPECILPSTLAGRN